jgi:neopullulanase
MKKKLNMISQRKSFLISILGTMTTSATDITHMDPPFSWAGMENRVLQILVYGENISGSKVSIAFPGISIKEVVGVESPNYLFIWELPHWQNPVR